MRVDIMGNGFLEVLNARDISVGGLSVFVRHDFEDCDLNSEVELIITLGHKRPFKAKGIIRHRSRGSDKHFFGIQFTELGPEHRASIDSYVAGCLGRR